MDKTGYGIIQRQVLCDPRNPIANRQSYLTLPELVFAPEMSLWQQQSGELNGFLIRSVCNGVTFVSWTEPNIGKTFHLASLQN